MLIILLRIWYKSFYPLIRTELLNYLLFIMILIITWYFSPELAGLSVTQRVENAGICTCQMALQLVGKFVFYYSIKM